MTQHNDVVIIGGGWAGLAAALELDAHNIPVSLYESAPQLGGRARNAPFGDFSVDNGQHLLIGAYREILRLLTMIGVEESEVLLRTQLCLKVVEGNETLLIQPPALPAPLHLAWAQLTARGLSMGERLRALLMSLQLMLSKFTLVNDISVAELLQQHRQGDIIVRRFWEPLCIATLNTPIDKASAQVFLRVLRDSFTQHRHDADLLIPKEPLGDLFPQRAATFLQRSNNHVQLRQRGEALHIVEDQLEAITISNKRIPCHDAIIATAPHAAERLLSGHIALNSIREQLSALGNQPITTIYLQYPAAHQLEEPMLGMSGTLTQWLFDRRHCGQPGLIAVVISAEGEHQAWDSNTLTSHVLQEINRQFPHWPQPLDSRVINEKRATFECHVGIEAQRPSNTTPVKGLWLAGDYTDTSYPATLEGAVRSGVECAHRIIEQRH
ncbi:MAG: hydroxysqualene dehydroxylase HpnE [Pseudomonadota bacterium]